MDAPALDLGSILTLHRDPKGYIGFVRKADPANPPLDKHGKPKSFETLFSIRADELETLFPAFADWLAKDSYLTINAYYRPAPYRSPATGWPDVWRKEKYLATLNACYADIDCGRPESTEPGAALDWRQAQYEAHILADTGVIPQPSIMARSGRGVYLIWILRDEKDPTKPPRAWPEKIPLYKQCNRELVTRIRTHALPADKAAIDAARVLRTPGSVHSKSGRRVEYLVQLDQAGRGFVYTLAEIVDFLKLPGTDTAGELPPSTRALANPPTYRRVKKPGTAPLRSMGRFKLNAFRAQDLLTIGTYRGGFKKRGEQYADGSTSPGRRFILTLFACFLRGTDMPPDETTAALYKIAASMLPPYPSDGPADDPPIETLVQQEYAGKTRKWSNEKLCALLGITADLARELELHTIRPDVVAREADQARPLRADRVAARRDFARQYLERYGRTSARKLANVYKAAGFIGANAQTANDDLNALGFVMSRPRPGRPRKAWKMGK